MCYDVPIDCEHTYKAVWLSTETGTPTLEAVDVYQKLVLVKNRVTGKLGQFLLTLVPDIAYERQHQGEVADLFINAGDKGGFTGVAIYSIPGIDLIVRANRYTNGIKTLGVHMSGNKKDLKEKVFWLKVILRPFQLYKISVVQSRSVAENLILQIIKDYNNLVKVDDYWLYIDDNGDKYRLLDTDEDGLPDSIWILPDTEGGENTDTDTETEPDTDPKDDLPKRCDRCGLITCNGNCVTPGGGGNSGGENKTPEISYKDGYICIDFQDDVLDKDDFSPYKDSEPTGCFDRCKEMLAEAGCEVDGGRKPICITNNENGTPIGISTDFQNGINEINKTLDNGKPIILNVDHTEGKCTSTDGAGDHFVIVVGKAVIDGNTYYHFYDPATGDVNTGTKNTNVLYVKEDGYLSGTFIKRNGRDVKDYTVTSVRPNKNI